MAGPRKKTAYGILPADTPHDASRVFARRPAGERATLASDAIAADMDTFRQAGSMIGVLGTTSTPRKINHNGEAKTPPAPVSPTTTKPRR